MEPSIASTLALDDSNLAPWLGGETVAAIFDASATAPATTVDAANRVLVSVNDLSVPLVYGVPADEWDVALGLNTTARQWQAAEWGATSDDPRQLAIIAALEAVENGGEVLVAALALLATALGSDGPALADGWRDTLDSLLTLGYEIYGTDTAICSALHALENTICTSH